MSEEADVEDEEYEGPEVVVMLFGIIVLVGFALVALLVGWAKWVTLIGVVALALVAQGVASWLWLYP